VAEEAGSLVDEYARSPEPPSAVEEEAAPFTPAATEAQDEAWMPWETPDDAGTTRSEAPAAEDDAGDLPWLVAEPAMQADSTLQEPAFAESTFDESAFQEPAFQESAFQEPAAEEVPGWMTWTGEQPEAVPDAEPDVLDAEPDAGDVYSFDVESFDAAPLETPVPDAALLDTASFGAADDESQAFGGDPPFSFAAEPESIAGEQLLYGTEAMEPLDVADAFPETAEEPAAWDTGAPVHVSEAEAAPESEASPWESADVATGAAEDAGAEAWSAGFAVEEPATDAAADAEEPAAGMEDYLAAEENTAADEALYAPVADGDYEAGSGYGSGYTEPAAESDHTSEYTRATPESDYATGYAQAVQESDYASGYAESAPEVGSGFHAPEAESAFPGEAAPVAAGDSGPAALAGGTVDAMTEVAERLEGIARRLREQPAEVLAGGAGTDPLELLVTGFALGYAQGRRAAG
jgi:hypothetical protein